MQFLPPAYLTVYKWILKYEKNVKFQDLVLKKEHFLGFFSEFSAARHKLLIKFQAKMFINIRDT